jgi:hypothetical protein
MHVALIPFTAQRHRPASSGRRVRPLTGSLAEASRADVLFVPISAS